MKCPPGVRSGLCSSSAVKAYDLATGKPAAGFTSPESGTVKSLAVSGNLLFVGYRDMKTRKDVVGEFDAKTGAALNAAFISDAKDPWALAVMGKTLLVRDARGGTVGAFGLPDKAAAGNVPTSSNLQFLTGFIGQNPMVAVP